LGIWTCPSSSILETRNHKVSKSGCFRRQVRGGSTYLVGSLRKS
jgi:hypothetical protein